MALAVRPTFSDPSYQVRQSLALGSVAAGSGGVTAKWVAFANAVLYSLNLLQQVLSTSTYNGTASVQQISVIVIQNTSATSTAALSTATYGPFLAGGAGTAGQLNVYNQYALNTTTGTQGYGGIPIPQGSLVYCVSGTDATAVTACSVDYQINTGAGLTV
jgi:hypothetical protein